MTKQRELVIAELRSAKRYLTAKELFARVAHLRPRVGLATIYRTLDALREMKWVATTSGARGEAAYLWCRREHHHHAVCRRCGRVDDVPCKTLPSCQKILARGLRFRVTEHQMEFYGLCARCS